MTRRLRRTPSTVPYKCSYPGFKTILLGSDVSEDIAAALEETEDMTTERNASSASRV